MATSEFRENATSSGCVPKLSSPIKPASHSTELNPEFKPSSKKFKNDSNKQWSVERAGTYEKLPFYLRQAVIPLRKDYQQSKGHLSLDMSCRVDRVEMMLAEARIRVAHLLRNYCNIDSV